MFCQVKTLKLDGQRSSTDCVPLQTTTKCGTSVKVTGFWREIGIYLDTNVKKNNNNKKIIIIIYAKKQKTKNNKKTQKQSNSKRTFRLQFQIFRKLSQDPVATAMPSSVTPRQLTRLSCPANTPISNHNCHLVNSSALRKYRSHQFGCYKVLLGFTNTKEIKGFFSNTNQHDQLLVCPTHCS